MGPDTATGAMTDQVARASYARLLGLLAARTRDLAAAEDALADAFRTALETWPRTGVPDRPEAWLMTVAKRSHGAARARAKTALDALPTLHLMHPPEATSMPDSVPAFPDHRLALMFACTHPAIDAATQTPLMLQVVLGLPADRIAPAFLMTAAALGQRLSRAKARLKSLNISFDAPDPAEVSPRLPAVLEAIHAAAALGWEPVPGCDPARADLTSEALYLAETLITLTPDQPEPQALLALILFTTARAPARRTGYTPLSEQNTALWDSLMLDRADRLLATASRAGRLGRFQLMAAIQSVHTERRRTGQTNWSALETLHAALNLLHPTAGGQIAAAAVTLERHGPAPALRALDALTGLDNFQPYWALRAEALRRARAPDAMTALTRALGLAEDPALRAWLAQKLA
jgi:RNA polymerase sigma-70 factor (ECF subfamily)